VFEKRLLISTVGRRLGFNDFKDTASLNPVQILINEKHSLDLLLNQRPRQGTSTSWLHLDMVGGESKDGLEVFIYTALIKDPK